MTALLPVFAVSLSPISIVGLCLLGFIILAWASS